MKTAPDRVEPEGQLLVPDLATHQLQIADALEGAGGGVATRAWWRS